MMQILVHGEKTNMMRLKSKLLSLNANKAVPTKIYSPANCEEVRIPFRQDKIAKVVGRLANQIQIPTSLPSPPSSSDDDGPHEDKKVKLASDQIVSGVLVQNDFKLSLMAPEDLKEYAGLTTTTILCRQRLTLGAAGVDLIKWALEGTFGTVKVTSNGKAPKIEPNGVTKREDADEEIDLEETVLEVMSVVRVICRARGEVEVEWEGNVANDGIADAVLAVLFTVESSPAAVKQSSKQHSHSHGHDHEATTLPSRNPHANITPAERLSRLCMFLEAHFGEEAITPIAVPKLPTISSSSAEAGEDQVAVEKAQAVELDRLHKLGIPVPGLEIKVDKSVAKIWLEKLEVECATRSLADRVRAVVDRGCEVVAPLWE